MWAVCNFQFAHGFAFISDVGARNLAMGYLAVVITDPGTGALSGRRPFVTVPNADGVPDGLALDAEGCVWLAVWDSGELRRYTPAGRLDTVVRLPARQGYTDAERREQPHAGDIFACAPGVTGRLPFLFGHTP